jgi:hypothetical protein
MEKFKKNVVIIIPIHSENPSNCELSSFAQCFKVLGSHPIVAIAPFGLNLRNYKKVIPDFNIHFIDPEWLSSKLNYNKLKVSNFFYSKFHEYEYLLTYELDAYVFKDDLLYWCNKNYDYIGAPWFEGWHETREVKDIIGVGNSGFSLRRTSTSLKILKRILYIRYIYKLCLCRNKKANIIFNIVIKLLEGYFKILNPILLPRIVENNSDNEDIFWCKLVGKTFIDFNIAPVSEAIQFSFENNPALLFEHNNRQLPFGCHAWKRYDPNFWGKHID